MENYKALKYISYADTGTKNHIKSSKSGGFARRPKTGAGPRKGVVCPACGMERSLAGFCECNA